ncbi:MAG: hypothetical protein A2350_12495 [Candidatus Raymondbacteria bacterium RifOxyB12_full_50_8]|nr:MAG: hypothetical protein A2350_12495 [Candidatus Raymondbacteria bacterium RifOxyB12_full_50_8]
MNNLKTRNFLLIFFWVGLAAFSFTANAETYYVDKNHSSADNANAGTEGKPWKTIQKGANVAIAGDTVYVKNGVYNEWVEVKNSGTPDKPITFKAFPSHKPVIDGTGIDVPSSPRWYALFYSYLKSYITLDGFEVMNSDEVLIRMMGYVGNYVEGLIVRNCIVHDNSNVTRNGIHMCWVNNGLIEHNDVSKTGWNAISTESCSNTPIQYNYVHDNVPHAGINVFPNTSEDPQQLYAGNHIIGNIVTRLGNPGGAVYTRFQVDNFIINNLIYENTGSAIVLDHNHTGPTYSHESRTKILNNTIVDNGDYGFSTLNASHVTLKNNIIAYNGNTDIKIGSDLTMGATLDNNVYYESMRISWGGSSYASLSSFQSSVGQDIHSLYAEPGFENRINDDYSLKPGSPAIDAGADLSSEVLALAKDLVGTPRPQGSGWDIGAYEYNAGVAVKNSRIHTTSQSALFWYGSAIRYTVAEPSYVRISVYNHFGQIVGRLVNGEKDAGAYEIKWNGRGLANGSYLCRMETENDCFAKKVFIMR